MAASRELRTPYDPGILVDSGLRNDEFLIGTAMIKSRGGMLRPGGARLATLNAPLNARPNGARIATPTHASSEIGVPP
jgi:hypothetical protein